MGEQPVLWSKLKLHFFVYKEGRGNELWEVDGEGRVVGPRVEGARPPYVGGLDSVHICGWTEELVKVLTMPRLQSLEHLALNFFYMSKIFWQDCIHFLQLVSNIAPSVKKLSWNEGTIAVTPNPTPVEELAEQLMGLLVKFEEVHFSQRSFDEDISNHLNFDERPPRFGNGINSAILRALPAASGREDSKLKVLTLDCHEFFFNRADLAGARKKLTVNIVSGEK